MSEFGHMPMPNSLQYYVRQMNISRQRYRTYVDSRIEAKENSVVTFSFPNALVALDTLSLHFTLDTNSSTADVAYLSEDVASLIDQIMVECQGTAIDVWSGTGLGGWNRFANIWKDYTKGRKDLAKTVLEHQLKQSVTLGAGVHPGKHTAKKLMLREFPGTFLETAKPRVIDFALAPIKLSFKFAGKEVFLCENAANLTSVSITDIWLDMDTITLNDGGLYEAKIQERLMKGDFLEIPFDHWSVHTTGARDVTDTQVFGLSTANLKGLLGVHVNPLALSAPNNSNVWNINASDSNFGRSSFFLNGLSNDCGVATSQYFVNNTPFPAVPASAEECWDATLQSFGVRDTVHPVLTIGASCGSNSGYQQVGGAAHYVRFDYPNAEDELRARSGINLLGQNATITRVVTGSGAAKPTKITYAQEGKVLRIGSGRQVQLIN